MNSIRRRCFVIILCTVVVFILYWTYSKQDTVNFDSFHHHAAAAADEDDDDVTYVVNPDEPQLPTAKFPVHLTGADSDNNNVVNVYTGANEADNDEDDDDDDDISSVDSSNRNSSSHVMSNSSASAGRQSASPASVVSASAQDVTTLSLDLPSSSSSSAPWQLLPGDRQQLNHAIVSEKRRLAMQKQRLQARKLRFDKELSELMKEMRRGGVMEVHRKPVPQLSALGTVDGRHWQGLNISYLHTHYPGIIPMKDYVLAEELLSNDSTHAAGMQGQPHSLDDLTDGQLEDRFYQLVCKVHVECLEMRRIGSFDDGGYDLCTSQPYHFTSNDSCIVYSFGINFDFTFDDAMASAFSCTVKCFDPSMTIADHLRSAKVHFYQVGLGAQNTVTDRGWKLMTLRTIQSKLGHSKSVIDVLKIDIDYAEWTCLRQMLSDGALLRVKQLIVEIHTSEVSTVRRPTSRQEFVDMYQTLAALERAGFRRYHYHYNPLGTYTSVRTGKTRTCCYELNYINIHFLHFPASVIQ